MDLQQNKTVNISMDKDTFNDNAKGIRIYRGIMKLTKIKIMKKKYFIFTDEDSNLSVSYLTDIFHLIFTACIVTE